MKLFREKVRQAHSAQRPVSFTALVAAAMGMALTQLAFGTLSNARIEQFACNQHAAQRVGDRRHQPQPQLFDGCTDIHRQLTPYRRGIEKQTIGLAFMTMLSNPKASVQYAVIFAALLPQEISASLLAGVVSLIFLLELDRYVMVV
ncbi:hypothetical protein [Hydrogenophaga soli]